MFRLVKNLTHKIFHNLGYEIIRRNDNYIVLPHLRDLFEKHRMLYEYLLDNQLLHLIKQLGINCVLDVGANVGQFAQKIRRAGYGEYIISFEPVQETYAKLAEISANDPKWYTYPYALGSENSTNEINITSSAAFCSFYEPNDHCDEFGAKNATEIIGKECVTVRRLDSIIEQASSHVDDPRFFLKMDTQGHDIEVFKGVGKYMDQVLGLQSELAVIPIYQKITRMNHIISEYESHGYEIVGLFPVNWDKKTSRVIEFDCVMTKTGIVQNKHQLNLANTYINNHQADKRQMTA